MPRIVYLSWPAGEISGGIKAIFQHVALLREAGMDAAVATEDGRAPEWFRIPAPQISLQAVQPDDALVFPENSPALLQRFAGSPQRKLVFCQNPYYAWQGLAGHASYAAAGVSGVLCPSVTVLQFARRRLPDLAAWYTPFYIDERLFVPGPKTLQIACIPRKRAMEMGAIHDLFRHAHPRYAHLSWQVLQGATEEQVAEVLGRSAVYLGLARLEAHGMTSLEAMACGCLVAGFGGVAGGTDSATANNGFWVPEDDVYACVDKLAEAVRVAERGGALYTTMVGQARRTAANYRREESARLLIAFWREWLGT
jgi:hypothetical protein